MYESFFKFEKPPFKLVADPSMLFASRSVREALSRLEYAVRSGKGITVMTGEVGTGKTTLVNRFLDQAGPDLHTAYLFNPSLSGLQLLKILAEELGVQTAGMAKVDLTRAIYEVLLRDRQAGRRAVLFVDEAQILSYEALEELRLISNLETWQEKLLHIVLVGQPELLRKLESWNLRQLRQRVELFVRIDPMDAEETRLYIQHRLRRANPLRPVHFTDGACKRIHELSRGIPRDINKLCDAALLVAFVEEASTITSKHVREAEATIEAQEDVRPRRLTRARGLKMWRAAAAVFAMAGVLVALSTLRDVEWPRSAREPGARAVQDAAPTMHPSTALVHLASFRDRDRAERFAAVVTRPPGTTVYLQRVERDGETWHRVLLGDFPSLAAARAFAAEAQEHGTYRYVQAVQVPEIGLEAWHASR